MIGRLRGVVIERDPAVGGCVLDVQGVGYEVFVPLRSLSRMPSPPEPTVLHVHTHVREEALTLYGFQSLEDRLLFRALTGVSGVGPKLAMTILSDMTGEVLCTAVAQGDKKRFAAITGVGPKLAARLALELRDKVPLPSAEVVGSAASWPDPTAETVPLPQVPGTPAGEVLQALMSLGFSRQQAEAAVSGVITPDEKRPVEVLLRQALSNLAGR